MWLSGESCLPSVSEFHLLGKKRGGRQKEEGGRERREKEEEGEREGERGEYGKGDEERKRDNK